MKTKELILNLLSEESSLSPKEIASKVNKSDGNEDGTYKIEEL